MPQERVYSFMSRRFEQQIADSLPIGPDTGMFFAGRALQPMTAARSIGYDTIELVSPTSHISNVLHQHKTAASISGFNDTWLSTATHDRILKEYEEADRIYVHSDYVRQSFIQRGIPAEKLERTWLVPNPRFVAPAQNLRREGFQVAYVGRLDSSKGIHLLVDAFKDVAMPDWRLVLVGGWTTRAMKKYITGVCDTDARITAAPGDPLPVLHRSNVLVHPSFEDGFAYAPLEALCTGIPVIVTEDTGMKEFVVSGDNGFVVPTGDVEALKTSLTTVFTDSLAFDSKILRKQFYA